jgi:hypothetical protein
MAYDPGAGRTVLCVPSQRPWTVETWLYDLTADAWKRMPDADLNDVDRGISRDCGSLIYDENHHICLFVIHQVKDRRRGPLTVWALRIDESKLK